MEASAVQAPATLAKPRVSIPTPLLRFRSDEQLVALFRAGHDEAFRAIHDRYHKRLFAYARQMLPGRQDAEDALQDVFVRAYSGLRASDRDLALRAWLFRVAHNRCIDELRRPAPPAPEVLQLVRSGVHDPVAEADIRESLRRLIDDVRRLPDQQRSALLLRELGGMSYAELGASLGISVGAVKSLLVRARIALAQAATARDTACSEIHEQLVVAYERGLRPNANARRHMRDCAGCRGFRRELRGVTRRLAALGPAVGPLGLLTKVLGFTGGAGGGATAGSATAGGATAGGAALVGGTGVAAGTGGAFLGAGHVATLIAAAVATAGGAVEIQHTISAPAPRPPAHVRVVPKHAQRYVAASEPPAPPATYAPAADFQSAEATVPSPASDVTKSKIVALERVQSRVKSALRSAGPNGTGGSAMFGPPTSSPSTTSATTGASLPTTDLLDGEGTSTGTGDSSGSSSTSTGTGGSATSNTSMSSTSSTGGSSTGSTSGPGSTTTSSGGSSSSTSGTSSSGTSSTSSSGSGSSSTSGSSTSSSGSGSLVPPK